MAIPSEPGAPRAALHATSVASPDSHSPAPAQDGPIQDTTLNKMTSEPTYPSFSKTLLIVLGLLICQFLGALDRMIIGVAIPKITDDFNSLGDVGWYGSAFLLTAAAFVLLIGRVYTFYSPKWIYLGSLAVFEIGSAICGAAPNSTALILGRAIAGLGTAGQFQGAIVIIVHVIPLRSRPQWMGLFGLMFGVASVAGPLVGGLFTEKVSWRWCFYINLPFGGLVMAILVLFLHLDTGEVKPTTLKEKLSRLDPLGTFFFLPSVISLLLALQWGGTVYAWSNPRIIVLLVLFPILFIAFLVVQRWKGETATVPGRIFFNRSILAGTWFNFFNGGAMLTMLYFLPIWFQAIKNASAVKSGIMNLPMLLGVVISTILAGTLTKKFGYYTQFMILCAVITSVGAGLISTFQVDTSHSKWIGYQALFGLGLGMGIMQASVAAQTVLSRKDVAIGASIMMFSQTIGGTVFISVGNNLFLRYLSRGLAEIQGLDVGTIVNTGATELRHTVPPDLLPQVLIKYNAALRTVFYMTTALCSVTIMGALAMEWKSVKEEEQQAAKKAAASEEKKLEREV